MDVLKIPFIEFVGLEKSENKEYIFKIEDKKAYHNHLGTLHAGVLFTLAEATSGKFLLRKFEKFKLNVIPVVRKVEVKYSKPGSGEIFSDADLVQATTDEIVETLTNLRRTIIKVKVELFDKNEEKIMIAIFDWFVTVVK